MKWLKCEKCKIVDKSTQGHIGTSTIMRCKDCGGYEDLLQRRSRMKHEPIIFISKEGHAKLCRNCCPTNHGTKWHD